MTALLTSSEVLTSLDLNTEQSGRLDDLIARASRICEQFADNVLGQGTFDELHRIGPSRLIYLKRRPVLELLEVQLGLSTMDLDPADYSLDEDAGVLSLRRSISSSFSETHSSGAGPSTSVRVRYRAGYDDVPEDVKHAVILVIKAILASEQAEPGIQSRKLADSHYQRFPAGSFDLLPAPAQAILDRYRRIKIA